MLNSLRALQNRLDDRLGGESGQGLVEYALILALIALAAIVALTVFGTNLTTELSTIATSVSSA